MLIQGGIQMWRHARIPGIEHEMTSAFLWFHTGARVRHAFQEVQDGVERVVTDSAAMVEVVREYYQSFLGDKEVEVGVTDRFIDLVAERVSSKQAAALEAPLTLEELTEALSRMKVPGQDRLPVEFYVTLWELLGTVLLEVLTEGLQEGTWSRSIRVGVLTLLYKSGDARELQNWRP